MTPEEQKKYFDNPLLAIQDIQMLRGNYQRASEFGSEQSRKCYLRGLRIEELERENKTLRDAIEKTIEDNLHLADGDVCTLIDLKRALVAVGVES